MNIITTTALDLATALDATVKAAAKPAALTPILEAVHVRPDAIKGLVNFEATDRYRVHRATVPAIWEGESDKGMLLHAADVKPLVAELKRWAKERKGSAVLVTLAWERGMQPHVSAATLGRSTTVRAVVDADGRQYPALDRLFPDHAESEGPAFRFNPAHLADALSVKDHRVRGNNEPSVIHPPRESGKQMIVKHGGWFTALLMGVRGPEIESSIAPTVEPMQESTATRAAADAA